jgi:hypothetical protein
LQGALFQYVIMVAVSSSILFGSYWGIRFTAKELFKDGKGFSFLMNDL